MVFEIFTLGAILLFNLVVIFTLLSIPTQRSKKSRKLFVLLNVFVVFWVLSIFITDLLYDLITVSLWASRLSFLFSIFIAFFLYRFVKSYQKSKLFIWDLIGVFLETLSILFGIASLTKFNVSNVIVLGENSLKSEVGFLYQFISLFISIYFVFSIILFFKIYKEEKNLSLKSQIGNILIGSTLSIFSSLITNILMPMFGFPEIRYLGPLSLGFFLFFTYYSILRERYLGTKQMLFNTIYTFLFAFIPYAAFHLITFLQNLIWGSVFETGALITGFFYSLLFVYIFNISSKWLSKFVKGSVLNYRYDPLEQRDLFMEKTRNVLEIDSLISILESFVKNTIHPMQSHVVLKAEYVERKILENNLDFSFSKLNSLIKESDLELPIITDEVYVKYIEDKSEIGNKSVFRLWKYLDENNVRAVFMIKDESRVYGYLVLGDLEDGSAYSVETVEMLEFVTDNIAMAINRALLYQKVKNFNFRLQDEIKAATKNLERANEDLRELDKAKDDLISIASHELRTPATIVKGKLHMLKKRVEKLQKCESYDKKIDTDIDVCIFAIEREIEQVNTLLEASRIGKDTMVLDRQLFDVSEIAENAVDDFVEIAKEKGLDLSFTETVKDFPFVSIDVRRIREVIDNLITNAIKYTDEGSIQVRVFQKNARSVCVSIIDTGIGIAKNKKEKLFTKFYRVRNDDENRSQLVKPGGTGLGLFVAKNIVEKHGGEIWLESEEGKGSIFTFCLPVTRKKQVK